MKQCRISKDLLNKYRFDIGQLLRIQMPKIALADCFFHIEPNPGFQFFDKGRIVYLGCIAIMELIRITAVV